MKPWSRSRSSVFAAAQRAKRARRRGGVTHPNAHAAATSGGRPSTLLASASAALCAHARSNAGDYASPKLARVSETETQQRELWGAETRKAVANFPVSGESIPRHVARWLGRIKAAAARVNAELGLLDEEKAQRIGEAGDRIAAGELDDQFPIDVFQTGSGTSSNMNANEVIAALAGEDVHANDDVKMGQSSNDVFPSAVHLAALDELTEETSLRILAPANPFEAQAARDALVEASGALKVVAVSLTKIANDLRLMGSGPRA